eukprot:m.155499 g.155499  ORF g.155499 m.155499 type:complete len:1095 (-) comp14311_c0_seq9:4819-8103(-)
MPPKKNTAAAAAEAERQAKLAEEERKKEIEKQEQAEAEKRRQYQRSLLLHQNQDRFTGEVQQLNADYERLVSALAAARERQAATQEWQRTVDCTNVPYLWDTKAVNTYVCDWVDEDKALSFQNPDILMSLDLKAYLTDIHSKLLMAKQAEELALLSQDIGEQDKVDSYLHAATTLRDACKTKTDTLKAVALQFADKYIRPLEEDLVVRQEICDTADSLLHFYLWGNIARNPNFIEVLFDDVKKPKDPDASETTPDPEAPEPAFVRFSLPKTLAMAPVAVSIELSSVTSPFHTLLPSAEPKIVMPPEPSLDMIALPVSVQVVDEATGEALQGESGPSSNVPVIVETMADDTQADKKDQAGSDSAAKPAAGDAKTLDQTLDPAGTATLAPPSTPSAQTLRPQPTLIYHPFHASTTISDEFQVPEPTAPEPPSTRPTRPASRKTSARSRSARSGRSASRQKSAASMSATGKKGRGAEPAPEPEEPQAERPPTPEDPDTDDLASSDEEVREALDEHEVDRRNNIFVGPIVALELLSIPQSATRINKWIMRPIEEPMEAHALTYPLPNAPRVVDAETGEAVDAKAGVEPWPELEFRIPAPPGIVALEDLSICYWNEDREKWMVDKVFELKIEESREWLTFKTLGFFKIRFFMPKGKHWAIHDWNLLPFRCPDVIEQVPPPPPPSESQPSSRAVSAKRGVSGKKKKKQLEDQAKLPPKPLTVQEQDALRPQPKACSTLQAVGDHYTFYIEVSDLGCRLLSPRFKAADHLANWCAFPLFVSHMIKAGLDIFPALQRHYKRTTHKNHGMENELYKQMALCVGRVAFRSSVFDQQFKKKKDRNTAFVVRAGVKESTQLNDWVPATTKMELQELEEALLNPEEFNLTADPTQQGSRPESPRDSPVPSARSRRASKSPRRRSSVSPRRRSVSPIETQRIASPRIVLPDSMLKTPSTFQDFYVTYVWQDRFVLPVNVCEGNEELVTHELVPEKTIHATLLSAIDAQCGNTERPLPFMFDQCYKLLKALRPISRTTLKHVKVHAYREKARLLKIKRDAEEAERQRLEELAESLEEQGEEALDVTARSEALSAKVAKSRQMTGKSQRA